MDKISFDFDGCLDCNAAMQALARLYYNWGIKVFILTARFNDWRNADILKLAAELGIPQHQILFSAGGDKSDFIIKHGIDLHYDNDEVEVHQINTFCGPSKAVLVHYLMRTTDDL